MKRIVIVMLFILACCTLVSCGEKNEPRRRQSTDPSSKEKISPTAKVSNEETPTPKGTDAPVISPTYTPAVGITESPTPMPIASKEPTEQIKATSTPTPVLIEEPTPTESIRGTITATPCITATPTPVSAPDYNAIDGIHETGQEFTFGYYEQDKDLSNGPEPIVWVAIDVNDSEGIIEAISLYCFSIDPLPDGAYCSAKWEENGLREWLNNYFYYTAFSEYEQSKILTTTVKAEKNPKFNTDPGNDTEDKVYILSISEADEKLPSYMLLCYRAGHRNPYDKQGNSWWLRSPGMYDECAG